MQRWRFRADISRLPHCTWGEANFARYKRTAVLTLLVLQGPDKGRRYELPDAPALLGRESRQLHLSDNTVSRRHAELHPTEGEWILKDLGSSNGTYVNGQRVVNTYALK